MRNIQEELDIIWKGSDMIVGSEELEEKLKAGKTLVVKLGLDPTAPDIHLGHTVVLRKMKQLQDMGHHIVIIIGDFTGRIGDPSGTSRTRKQLSEEEIKHNARTYFEQVFRVLDEDKTEIRYNSEWLDKMTPQEFLELTSSTTVARMLERDDFESRFKKNTPIGIHEFIYPLLQARDSVELEADIEVGGADQTFNLLMGRTLQKRMGQSPQAVVSLPLLTGTDGLLKMSKSLNNSIGISEEPREVFRKLMEIPDDLIISYFELLTDEKPADIEEVRVRLEKGANPRDEKLKLAGIITGLYNTEEATEEAREYFLNTFSKGVVPENVPEVLVNEWSEDGIREVLIRAAGISSKSEFNRLLAQGGLSANGEKITRLEQCGPRDVVKVGRKQFYRLIARQVQAS